MSTCLKYCVFVSRGLVATADCTGLSSAKKAVAYVHAEERKTYWVIIDASAAILARHALTTRPQFTLLDPHLAKNY